jgi:hypothetical protein
MGVPMLWTDSEYQLYQIRRSTTAPTRAAQDVSEATLLAKVMAEARRLGYLVYHTHDSRRSAPGFPDLVLCNGQRLLFVELKSRTGKCVFPVVALDIAHVIRYTRRPQRNRTYSL